MDAYATPVRRDDFLYHGELFVDPGNTKHYKRASATDLATLLKPSKSSTKPVKDETAHFYEAQLVHYGLQRTKDKARAKLRLLDAIHAGPLQVPKDVKKTEAELKKLYTAQNKKPKAEPKDAAPTDKPKKRKRDNDDVAVTRPSAAGPSSTPRAKQTPTTPISTRGSTRGGARGGSKTAAALTRPAPLQITQSPQPAAQREKQYARRSRTFLQPSTSSRPIPAVNEPPGLGRGPNAASVATSGRGQKQTARCSRGARAGSKTKTVSEAMSYTEDSESHVQVSGFWTVSCPMIEQDFNRESTLELKLGGPGHDGFIWGRYDFGPFEGFMYGQWYRSSDTTVTSQFFWRGRDSGTGEMSIEDGQIGGLTIDANGTLQGNIEELWEGSMWFSASLDGFCEWEDWQFESEWDSLNEEEYEYERVNRWR